MDSRYKGSSIHAGNNANNDHRHNDHRYNEHGGNFVVPERVYNSGATSKPVQSIPGMHSAPAHAPALREQLMQRTQPSMGHTVPTMPRPDTKRVPEVYNRSNSNDRYRDNHNYKSGAGHHHRVPHSYERNIVKIKNEYTIFLVNIMTPLLYEGIKSIYNYALQTHEQLLKKANKSKTISPGPLKIFQTCLKDIPTITHHQLEKETARIKEFSRCSDWFDDLFKAVIKSNIVLLTFTTSKRQSEIVKQKYHEQVSTTEFIHKCYIEAARNIYDNPELFWHEYPSLEIKRNQRDTCDLIKNSIKEAIRKMLPIKMILKEYLSNDYLLDEDMELSNINDSQYVNMRSVVENDIHGGDNQYRDRDRDRDRNRGRDHEQRGGHDRDRSRSPGDRNISELDQQKNMLDHDSETLEDSVDEYEISDSSVGMKRNSFEELIDEISDSDNTSEVDTADMKSEYMDSLQKRLLNVQEKIKNSEHMTGGNNDDEMRIIQKHIDGNQMINMGNDSAGSGNPLLNRSTGSLGSLGSMGSKGSNGSNGSKGSLGSLGSNGSKGSNGSLPTAATDADFQRYLQSRPDVITDPAQLTQNNSKGRAPPAIMEDGDEVGSLGSRGSLGSLGSQHSMGSQGSGGFIAQYLR